MPDGWIYGHDVERADLAVDLTVDLLCDGVWRGTVRMR
jgi:hypothetical protein